MESSIPPVRPPRRQQERSVETRARLLDATVDSLIDRGYAGTTTTVVCERAGVSRGAQLHHFPTRAQLVVEAVGRLAQRRRDELLAEAARGPRSVGADPADLVLERMWSSFSGPLFYAALELWVAARTDPELHDCLYELERQVGRAMIELWRELLGPDSGDEARFRELVELTLHLLRGMALQRILRGDDSERRRSFNLWKKLLREHWLAKETRHE